MSSSDFNFDPGDLRVESFKALPERRGREGTVQGYTHVQCTDSCWQTTCPTCLGCCEDNTYLSCF